jgi:hypothetical protein
MKPLFEEANRALIEDSISDSQNLYRVTDRPRRAAARDTTAESARRAGSVSLAGAVQLVRRLSQLIDSDVVARLEEAHAAFQALAHVLGLDAAAVVELWQRHDAEARELEDEAAAVMVARSRQQGGASARKAWSANASGGGGDRADAESLELDSAHLSMRRRIEACRSRQPEDVILRVNKAPVSNREEFLFAVQTSRAAATTRRPPTPAAAVPRGLSPPVLLASNVKLAVYRPSAAALLSLTLYLS